jgi:hypothetical protein
VRGPEGYHGPRCAHKDDCAGPASTQRCSWHGRRLYLRSSSTTEQRLLPHLNCPLPVKTSCCTARQKCVAQLAFRRTAGLRRPCRGGQPQAARPVRTAHSGRTASDGFQLTRTIYRPVCASAAQSFPPGICIRRSLQYSQYSRYSLWCEWRRLV